MYFNRLKYILVAALAAAAGASAETRWVPSIFEDFPAPGHVALSGAARAATFTTPWRLDALVPGRDLGQGPVRVTAVGLRLDETQTGPPGRVRGSVSLSATPAAALSARFAANEGAEMVTFFVTTRAGSDARILRFELPGGYRFDPGRDGNLAVRFELCAEGALRLDAAPAPQARLAVAPDTLAEVGTLTRETAVLAIEVRRERREPAPVVERGPRIEPGPGGRSEPPARPAGETVRAGRVAELEAQVARLEARIASLVRTSERLTAALERASSVRTRALAPVEPDEPASGASSAVRPLAASGQETTLRRRVAEGLALAAEGGVDAARARRLAVAAELRLSAGDEALAELGFALAWRALVEQAAGREPAALVPVAAGLLAGAVPLRRAPYDVGGELR